MHLSCSCAKKTNISGCVKICNRQLSDLDQRLRLYVWDYVCGQQGRLQLTLCIKKLMS